MNVPGFSLGSFKIYWETLLERSNFSAHLISFAETNIVAQILNLLINRGILEEVDNPCDLVLHPVIGIPKKDPGKLRLVIDFRALNKLFRLIPFDIKDRAKVIREIPEDACYYTVIHIDDAFFEIKINDERLRGFFGVHILGKYYRFTALPQGWKKSPAICQITCESLLGSECRPFARIYMDDMIILSRTIEEHWHHANTVLKKLQSFGIQIAWSKMVVCQAEIKYLVIKFSQAGLTPSPEILEKLNKLGSVDCSKISNWRMVQGLFHQYHRFGPR